MKQPVIFSAILLLSVLFYVLRGVLYEKTRVVHTYFDDIPQWTHTIRLENTRQLQEWRWAWEKAGWEPRVISSRDIDREKYDVDSAIQGIPLGPSKEYDRACYLRYFAMASVGGGWMSDYDLIPINLKPSAIPNGGRFTVHEYAVPSLVSGSQQEWERMAYVLTETGRNMMGKTDLFSDMMALQALPLDYFDHSTNVVGYNEKKGSILFGGTYSGTFCRSLMKWHGAHISHAAMSKFNDPNAPRHAVYRDLAKRVEACKFSRQSVYIAN